jgi:flagellar protein FliS
VTTSLPKKTKNHFIFRILATLVTIQLRHLGLIRQIPDVFLFAFFLACSMLFNVGTTNNDGFLPLSYEEIIMSTSASIAPTNLATHSLDVDSVTPYQVITLLLDGALERIDQAIRRITDGEIDEAAILVEKAIGIIGGLRNSLDLDQGEIATNLDALYDYILVSLQAIDTESPLVTLAEVKNLLQEIDSGWKGIADTIEL